MLNISDILSTGFFNAKRDNKHLKPFKFTSNNTSDYLYSHLRMVSNFKIILKILLLKLCIGHVTVCYPNVFSIEVVFLR